MLQKVWHFDSYNHDIKLCVIYLIPVNYANVLESWCLRAIIPKV